MEMDEQPMAGKVSNVQANGRRVSGRPRYGLMYGVKVAFVSLLMTVSMIAWALFFEPAPGV